MGKQLSTEVVRGEYPVVHLIFAAAASLRTRHRLLLQLFLLLLEFSPTDAASENDACIVHVRITTVLSCPFFGYRFLSVSF